MLINLITKTKIFEEVINHIDFGDFACCSICTTIARGIK